MDFKNVEKKYRPIPFWSWNSKLDKDETAFQVDMMDKVGLGGYFMHARGGLITEYMGEEWFENISVGIAEGQSRNMQAWAYDENGWPSGFGNGLVNGLGVAYQQKYLRYDTDLSNTENTICCTDGHRFYYEVNPFYVDTLDGKVTEKFIQFIYEPYYQKYKDEFSGFFTDEPQISRNGIPWSFTLEEVYREKYGENLLEHLEELFFEVDDYERTRVNFWKMITELFSQNYMKKLYDWCVEHNLGFTGHLAKEESPSAQITSNGACMPHYEYFTMPGMDWLGRRICDFLTPLQVASVAHQLGKKEILSETFALCGHNVGMDELKAIYQGHMVYGITKLCPHLEGYSLAGLRKRDYPPAMYYQQPWWQEYSVFVEAMSRIGKILSEGKVEYDTLLLHNQTSIWKCFNNSKNDEIKKYDEALIEDYHTLSHKHVLFHLGDEIIMERHAYVDGNTLVIGTQRYKTIVIPKNKGFLENTNKLLAEFESNGGIITTADEVLFNDICSSPSITYTERIFEGYKVYYFINNSQETIEAEFRQGSKMLDIVSGELENFNGKYTFAPYDSLVLIDDGSIFQEEMVTEAKEILNLGGNWEIQECGDNILTLDTCDVYFDDELIGQNENAIDVLYMAYDLKRSVRIKCEYSFKVADIPERCFLVCETPEKFQISVNGSTIVQQDCGWFVDKAFRKISLSEKLIVGKNVVSMEMVFAPDEKAYEDMEKAMMFESEKNKLSFDTEFESIYIVGDFVIDTPGTFEPIDKNAVRYTGDFVMVHKGKEVSLSNIEQQGFPFFAGRLTVRKTYELSHGNYELQVNKKGINAILVRVNGIDCGCIMWGHMKCNIEHALHDGTNIIELTLVNNLRNMLGPHHLPAGESGSVSPAIFYRRANIWTMMKEQDWNKNYCFVEVGL